jgi:hypothetical protein
MLLTTTKQTLGFPELWQGWWGEESNMLETYAAQSNAEISKAVWSV